MEWSDDAIVLSSRAHGESGAILDLLTRDHGRHAGLVRGGASRRIMGTAVIGGMLAASAIATLLIPVPFYVVYRLARRGAKPEPAVPQPTHANE